MTVASANPGPYTQASAKVFGNFSANGPKGCTRGRTVVILRNGVLAATVVTGASGEYSTTLQGVSSGNYQAGVEQRVIKRKHKEFICKLAARPRLS